MALLGSGFDPGVTNVFCAYVQKHLLDEIHYVDIVDCNAGSHGKAFATNFNPEINIREITARGRYWENGEWKETDPLSVSRDLRLPRRRREEELPALSRGARVAREEPQGPQAHPVLDSGDLPATTRGILQSTLDRDRGRRHHSDESIGAAAQRNGACRRLLQ